jgi:RNA polymerase sigma-70 factor, ECF subfamily
VKRRKLATPAAIKARTRRSGGDGLLIDRYRPAALKLARRVLGDTFDAEDVTQEALLQAFLGLRTLRVPDRFGPWLVGIVVNLSKMRIRSRRD